MNESPERVVVLWWPNWSVVAADPGHNAPVAVVRAHRVDAVSSAARAAGVVVGLNRREAQRRCPDLQVIAADVDRDHRWFQRVITQLEQVTARLEVIAAGRCVFPIRGPDRYFGGEAAVVDQLARVLAPVASDLAAWGVGIADGVFAATIAAGRAVSTAERSVVIPAGRSVSFLETLPTSTLALPGPVSKDLVDVLVRLGITRLGQLAALPRSDVLARFGAEGVVAHLLASGGEEHPPRLVDPPVDLDQELLLDPPADVSERVVFAAKSLADRFADQLGQRGLGCCRIVITLRTESGAINERCWRHDGVLNAAEISQRVRWQIDGWRSGRARHETGPVVAIGLHPDAVIPAQGRQVGFWGGVSDADVAARRVGARLQATLGADAVCRPYVRGGRSPGELAQLLPIDDPPPPQISLPWPGRFTAPLPIWVWQDPLPAAVLTEHGSPVAVTNRGVMNADPAWLVVNEEAPRRVEAWAGPWLADERWWDPLGHRRRARLQVQTDRGGAHLVALEAGQWWVEASYDSTDLPAVS